MIGNNLFDLWIGNYKEINKKYFTDQVSNRSIRDYFVEAVLGKYIKDFSINDFIYSEHGKPELEYENFSFNLSHSDEFLVLLICGQNSCGLDIQEIRVMKKYRDALESVFTKNELEVLDQGGANDQFFQLWSIKEAYIKATGNSIWFGQDYNFSNIISDINKNWIFSNNFYLYSTKMFTSSFLSIAVPVKPEKINFINFSDI